MAKTTRKSVATVAPTRSARRKGRGAALLNRGSVDAGRSLAGEDLADESIAEEEENETAEESDELDPQDHPEQDELDFSDESGTDDPVRMYLMQMGEIPLLTRPQEIHAAKQIEGTRTRYRHDRYLLRPDHGKRGHESARRSPRRRTYLLEEIQWLRVRDFDHDQPSRAREDGRRGDRDP